jgi:hypothetical protein
MAHYAVLDSGLSVVNVFVGRDENDVPADVTDWETYYAPEGFTVKRTSYNTRGGVHYDPETGEPSADQSKALRFNYASIGFTFNPDKGTDGAFIPPKPFDSWVLDEATCLWEAPEPYPADGESYTWNEETQEWTAVENETEVTP